MSINVTDLKSYISAGMSVLIEGKHGVGKTSALRQACDELGYTMWYANMSTIDVNTHLIGIPVVNDDKTDLAMVRPHTIDQADVVFLDEINRTGGFAGDVMNAVMELVNDGAINGEKLPNLKAVIAACNPDDGTYNVNPIDPATIDRFDIFMVANPEVDEKLIAKECGNKEVAEAVCEWHRNLAHNSTYVSPRRVGIIARGAVSVQSSFSLNTVRGLVGPESASLPVRDLYNRISLALKGEKKSTVPTKGKSSGKDYAGIIKETLDVAFDDKGNYNESSRFFDSYRMRNLLGSSAVAESNVLVDALAAHPGFPDDVAEAAIKYTHLTIENVRFTSVANDYLVAVQGAFAGTLAYTP